MFRNQRRYAHRINFGNPPVNQPPPGTIGLAKFPTVISYLVEKDATYHVNNRMVNMTPRYSTYTPKDSFDFDNWIRRTFSASSGDKVEAFLRKISPSERKQLVGLYLTSKHGEGAGSEAVHNIGSINIDPVMDFLNSIGGIQNKLGVKTKVSLGRHTLEGLQHLVNAQGIPATILESIDNHQNKRISTPYQGIENKELLKMAEGVELIKDGGTHPFPLYHDILYFYEQKYDEFRGKRKNYTTILHLDGKSYTWSHNGEGASIEATPKENEILNLINGWVTMKMWERGQITD